MKNTQINTPQHFLDITKFKAIDKGIYQALQTNVDITAGDYLLSLAFEFESENERDNAPYIIEDLLEKYLLYSPFISENENTLIVEFAVSDYLKDARAKGIVDSEDDSLASITQFRDDILGKRVFEREFEKDGAMYIETVIE